MRPLALAPVLAVAFFLAGCDATETDDEGFELAPITVSYDFVVSGADLQGGTRGVNASDPFDVADAIEAQGFGTADVVAARVLDNETAQLNELGNSSGRISDFDRVTLELGGGGDEPVDVADQTDFPAGTASVDLDVDPGADLSDVVRSGLIPAALRVQAPEADPDATYRLEVRLRLQVEVAPFSAQ